MEDFVAVAISVKMSLSEQLKVITDNTPSVVVDRKSRSKVHSRSLIFEPKIAATQDFELLYEIGLEGLDQLVSLDRRFDRFKSTLFSETSIKFDRNVSQQDTLQHLSENINQFLLLLCRYLNLSHTVKALEWLVRRFNINLYHGEMLLLTSLSYYKDPIFIKILNVIPKNGFPKIFESLLGFKELLKNPSMFSILKNFLNNLELFKLYTLFIIDQINNRLIFKEQLVFYLSVSINLLSANSKDVNNLEQNYLPIILNIIGNLLLSVNNSLKVAHDLKLSAFSLISVVSSILPLNSKLIISLSDSIIANEACLSGRILNKTLITLSQLWSNFILEDRDSQLRIKYFDIPESVLTVLKSEGFNVNKFLIFYYLSNINNANDLSYIFKHIDLSNTQEFQFILLQLLSHADSVDESVRVNVTKALSLMFKVNKALFKETLPHFKSDFKVSDLEMILLTTLDDNNADDADNELEDESDNIIILDNDEEQEDSADMSLLEQELSNIKLDQQQNFLHNTSTEEFNKICVVLLKNVSLIKKVSKKLDTESFVTFSLRFSLSPSIPLIARLTVIKNLNKVFSTDIVKSDFCFYLILPLVFLGLYDSKNLIRQYYLNLLDIIKKSNPSKKASLFLEDQIYNDVPKSKRFILAQKDGQYLLDLLDEENVDDLVLDKSKLLAVLQSIFHHSKSKSKKFGELYVKNFILNQWSLKSLHLSFKFRIWDIVSKLNNNTDRDIGGDTSDYRGLFIENDILSNYLATRNSLITECESLRLNFKDMENNLVNIVGGPFVNEKICSKEVDIFLSFLNNSNRVSGNFFKLTLDRITVVFNMMKSNEFKFKLTNKIIELILEESFEFDEELDFDPFDNLIKLQLDFNLILSVLNTVQLNNQIPEQSMMVKRKRRSSSQTKQNMARNDISNMASNHLKKLTIILDYLEYNLNENLKQSKIAGVGDKDKISCPEFLIELFKILTDLDYLGNDGHLPVLYAQETLANCMLISIKLMKLKNFTSFDSNSIRADLIVNSIRNSTSPQVQNKLLLVIAELASLAPEIILHSVMPIFTFMGAHTIKQDDEFSNAALQETVSRVIPALAQNGTTNVDEDIEFLLASFVAALQHIPRHRRNKLFSSLVKTLTVEKSLHTILFLVGTQYNKTENVDTKNGLLEFSSSLLKNFESFEQLASINKLLQLWGKIPNQTLEKNSSEYNILLKKPIFGISILSLTNEELTILKSNLIVFMNEIVKSKDDFNEINLLKLKLTVVLVDDDKSNEAARKNLLANFNDTISFLLRAIDEFTNNIGRGNNNRRISANLYKLLNNFLDMLPVSNFVDSIADSINPEFVNDEISINIAKNFTNLTISKFETELNVNNINDNLKSLIIEKLIPILISGMDRNIKLELQQCYLDCFAIVIHKLFTVDGETAFNNSKLLIKGLEVILTEKGLRSDKPELIISSVNAINNVVNILGIKSIGFFPRIIKPSFEIWNAYESKIVQDEEDEEGEGGNETVRLVHTAILLLYSGLVKKLPAFLGSNLEPIILTILDSGLVANEFRQEILAMIIKHVELSSVLKALINIWTTHKFYLNNKPENLGLYLNTLEKTIDNIDKKSCITNSTGFLRWLITSFEFRHYCEINGGKFNNNTIFRLENSFYKCGINFILKLNDKSFRPLFASLTRWAINGEDSSIDNANSRYLSFFKFFNKLQEELKSIITSYYSYLIEPVAELLKNFVHGKGSSESEDINLRRIVLISLNASFKYDQDDYWSQESRFQMICGPIIGQLSNIPDSIGKYLVKAITTFTANVSSDEYNNIIVNELIKYVSNGEEEERENSSQTKIWTIRTMKSIFQKLGETWLTYLPTLVPYIAELLEDDDESVELAVRTGLVRVIETVLGEPLDRYLE